MSTQAEAENTPANIDAKQVADYLRENPGFFNEETELVAELEIPHPCGNAVSLLERQINVLRDQNRDLKRKLMELVQVARDNDRSNERMHQLILDMMSARTLEQVVDTMNDHLQGEFNADTVSIHLFELPADQARESGIQRIDRENKELSQFDNFFSSTRPLVGRLKQEQLDYLFGDQAPALASAALIPLGQDASLGMLAIGSSEANRFQPGMGTLFLTHLGEIMGCCLKPFVLAAKD